MKQPIEVEKGKNKVNIREKYIIRELRRGGTGNILITALNNI